MSANLFSKENFQENRMDNNLAVVASRIAAARNLAAQLRAAAEPAHDVETLKRQRDEGTAQELAGLPGITRKTVKDLDLELKEQRATAAAKRLRR